MGERLLGRDGASFSLTPSLPASPPSLAVLHFASSFPSTSLRSDSICDVAAGLPPCISLFTPFGHDLRRFLFQFWFQWILDRVTWSVDLTVSAGDSLILRPAQMESGLLGLILCDSLLLASPGEDGSWKDVDIPLIAAGALAADDCIAFALAKQLEVSRMVRELLQGRDPDSVPEMDPEDLIEKYKELREGEEGKENGLSKLIHMAMIIKEQGMQSKLTARVLSFFSLTCVAVAQIVHYSSPTFFSLACAAV